MGLLSVDGDRRTAKTGGSVGQSLRVRVSGEVTVEPRPPFPSWHENSHVPCDRDAFTVKREDRDALVTDVNDASTESSRFGS